MLSFRANAKNKPTPKRSDIHQTRHYEKVHLIQIRFTSRVLLKEGTLFNYREDFGLKLMV